MSLQSHMEGLLLGQKSSRHELNRTVGVKWQGRKESAQRCDLLLMRGRNQVCLSQKVAITFPLLSGTW